MFITVVPAIRTIPGVEQFDYAVDDAVDIRIGDVLRVPFRKQHVPALIMERKAESAFAARAIVIKEPVFLLRLGPLAAEMLIAAAQRTSTSLPTVFNAWIRTVPKRATSIHNVGTRFMRSSETSAESDAHASPSKDVIHQAADKFQTRYLVRRWHDPSGLLSAARTTTGRTLILTPWQHRADLLAKELSAAVLHADIADGAAWKAVQDFCSRPTATLVATRIGAWLACTADTVLLDEPENDDFKSDESSPRLDARWFVEMCTARHPTQSTIAFATTPRLSSPSKEWQHTPLIELTLQCEPRLRRGMSSIEGLSAKAYNDILDAVEELKSVTIIHAVSGDRARVVCHDCRWSAACISCGFHLTAIGGTGLCRKCGRKQSLPIECPSCHGSNFARSVVGLDRLAEQCRAAFTSDLVRVITPAELQTTALPRNGLVIITEVSLIGGVIEDTRRRERSLITWRRLAAVFAASGSQILLQGSEEALSDCRIWLTPEGVASAWSKELEERKLFGYPPATRMTKLLVDGTEEVAQGVINDLTASLPPDWRLNGPYPVAFRAITRTPRWVVQLIAPPQTSDDALAAILNPFKSRAIIDLDPIAFFS